MSRQEEIRAKIDGELVRIACDPADEAAGRRAAAELLGHYRGRVYAWCLRHLGDHEQALDMAQEVLLKAWRSLPAYRGDSPFVAWLWTIARNRCLSSLRRPRVLIEEGYDGLEAGDPRPDEALEQKLDEERLTALIETTLEPVERRAIVLRCFERMPVDAITQALDIREKTGARAVLQRARRKLRAALADAGYEGDGGTS